MSDTLPISLLYKYKNNVFVETGTKHGDGIALALRAGFKIARSIEHNFDLYHKVYQQFNDNLRVKLYYGKSIDYLAEAIKDIHIPITFWLDAHTEISSPILEELDIISRHPVKDHVILIDDIRVFHLWGVTIDDIRKRLLVINPKYNIILENSRICQKDIVAASLV